MCIARKEPTAAEFALFAMCRDCTPAFTDLFSYLQEVIRIMQHEVMVSVIVLTYNHESYISQALDSIFMQDVDFSYEVLVGNDASTDNTKEILQEYADRYPDRLRVFHRTQNLGASRNAYELLLKTRGKYLAFCEGDDFWTDPNKLARQVDFLERNPSYIGCSHKCVIVDRNSQPKKNQRLNWVRYRDTFTLDDFRGLYLPGQTATIVKRNLFLGKEDPYPFLYQLNRNISDRTTTLLYLTKGPFACLPEVMSAYRQTGSSGISNQVYTKNPHRILHELEYTENLEQLASELSVDPGIFAPYYKQLYAWAVWDCLKGVTPTKKSILKKTAAKIGPGCIHPYAFVHGMLQKKGII